MERLDKFLSSRSGFSRKDIKELAKKGKITVNGIIEKDTSFHVSDNDAITVNGEIFGGQKHVYIMLHKPKGVVSVSESDSDTTVIDLLPDEIKRSGLFPAGRLDKDTTGFVLITDDGDFAHRILSPKRHVTKTYEVTLRDGAEESYKKAFSDGISLSDGTKCLSADIVFSDDPHKVTVRLREGRYHQVRRMFASLGNHVSELHRSAIGNLSLDENLTEGEARFLTEEELLLIQPE